MSEDVKCLRILKGGVSLKDIFKEEFLDKLNENFGELDVFPVGVAFAVQNEDITEDMIQLNYRNEDEINNNIVLIDAKNNHENINKIINSFND